MARSISSLRKQTIYWPRAVLQLIEIILNIFYYVYCYVLEMLSFEFIIFGHLLIKFVCSRARNWNLNHTNLVHPN